MAIESGDVTGHDRPSPRREILETSWLAARENFCTALAPTPNWGVGTPQVRRTSVLYPLYALAADGTLVQAFYKIFTPAGPNVGWRSQQLSQILARTPQLNARFGELAAGSQVIAAPVLGLDAPHLGLVTLSIGSGSLGRAWRGFTPLWGDPHARGRYRRVGQAIRLIEECTDSSTPMVDGFMARKTERCLMRGEIVFSGMELRRFKSFVGRLGHAAAAAAPRAVFAHCDISESNVMRCGAGIGLIDFLWRTALSTYDLACFVVRLQYESAWAARWSNPAISEVLQGYGDPRLGSRPEWLFTWFHRTLAMACSSGGGSRVDPRPRRALDAVRTVLHASGGC